MAEDNTQTQIAKLQAGVESLQAAMIELKGDMKARFTEFGKDLTEYSKAMLVAGRLETDLARIDRHVSDVARLLGELKTQVEEQRGQLKNVNDRVGVLDAWGSGFLKLILGGFIAALLGLIGWQAKH